MISILSYLQQVPYIENGAIYSHTAYPLIKHFLGFHQATRLISYCSSGRYNVVNRGVMYILYFIYYEMFSDFTWITQKYSEFKYLKLTRYFLSVSEGKRNTIISKFNKSERHLLKTLLEVYALIKSFLKVHWLCNRSGVNNFFSNLY